jgi:hypothetical protein
MPRQARLDAVITAARSSRSNCSIAALRSSRSIMARGVKFYLPIVAIFARSQVGQRVALSADLEIVAPSGKVQKLVGCCLANYIDPRAPTAIVLNPILDIIFLMRQIQAANTSCGQGSTTVRKQLSQPRSSVSNKGLQTRR